MKEKELLKDAINVLEDYLNAGCKESRRKASIKAKDVYYKYYKQPYKNKN